MEKNNTKVILAILLVATATCCITSVAAETIEFDYDHDMQIGAEAPPPVQSGPYSGTYVPPGSCNPTFKLAELEFTNIQHGKSLSHIVFGFTDGVDLIGVGGKPTKYLNSASTPVTYRIGDDVIGTGMIQYSRSGSGSTFDAYTLLFTFNSWNVGEYIGLQNVLLDYDYAELNNFSIPWRIYSANCKNHKYTGYAYQSEPFSVSPIVAGYYPTMPGRATIYGTSHFHQMLEYSIQDSYIDMSFDRRQQQNRIILTEKDGTKIYNAESDENINFWVHKGFSLSVQNPHTNTWWNNTYPEGTGGDETFFTLSLSPPTTATVGDTVTATLCPKPGAPNASKIWWSAIGRTPFLGPERPEQYQRFSTSWKKWNYTTNAYDNATYTEADVYNQPFIYATTGPATIEATVFDAAGNIIGTPQASIEITNAGTKLNLIALAYDAKKMTLIEGLGIEISATNLETGENETQDVGVASFIIPKCTQYRIRATAPGYHPAEIVQSFQNDQTVKLYLISSAAPPDNQTTHANFFVYGQNHFLQKNAIITLGSQTKKTNNQGYAGFVVQKNQLHTYTVSHPDYETTSGTLNINTATDFNIDLLSTQQANPTSGEYIRHQTSSEKAENALNILFDNLETFAYLSVGVLIVSMISWMTPRRRR